MRIAIALISLLALVSLAPAHDDASWIQNGHYRSPIDGSHCCGPADCVVVDDALVGEVRGGYHVKGPISYFGEVSNVDEVVPFKEVQPSRDGKYWRCKRYDGSRRCFFGPPPGS